MKPTNIKRKRILRNMIFITSILCFLLIVRIGVIQFVQGSELQSMAYSQQTLNRKINPKRGTIYDSTGKNVLAVSASVETVSVTPKNIAPQNKEKLAKKMAEIFDLNYENVLKTGYAVCEGYSNLLKKFLDTLGFQNSKVSGYARGVGTSLMAENNTDSNHAWNMVKIENAYYFIDSTWDSGYMNGKNSVQKYTTDWLFIKPEHFIFTHLPERQQQQLLKEPVSNTEFLKLADFQPNFFEVAENFIIKNGELPQKTNHVLNSIQFEYETKTNYYLDFSVVQTEKNKRIENATFTQTNGNISNTVIQFSEAGKYQIQIFYYKKTERQGTGCAEFFVNAQEGSQIRYPRIYQNSFDAKVICPIEMPLKKGETYHFEINCPDKNFAAVICGRKFSQMQKNDGGIFSLDFTVPTNISQLNIGVSSAKTGSYQTVATYICK